VYRGQCVTRCQCARPIGAIADSSKASTEHKREYNFRRDSAPSASSLNLKAVASSQGGIRRARPTEQSEPVGDAVCRRQGLTRPLPADHLPCSFNFKVRDRRQVDATTVVPPGASAEIDKYLNISFA